MRHPTHTNKELRDTFLKELATPMFAESLFNDIPDIVFCIKNNKGQYISANAAFAERLGLQSTLDILGKTAEDLFPPHLASTYLEQDHLVFTQGVEIKDRLELVYNRNGSLGWYLAQKVPLFKKNGEVIGLASISRDLLTHSDTDLQLAGIIKVVEKIQKHFDQDLKLSDLALLGNLSPTQLDRRMRKVFKLTTSQFISKTRIEAAIHMLTKTDKPIIDIALDCGYGDQSSFTRKFKSTVGMAPGAYRSSVTQKS